MENNYRYKAIAAFFGILIILGGCAYLVYTDVLIRWAIILAAWGCYPWAKYIWNVVNIERRNTIRILKNSLPKCGFTIEDESWNEDHTVINFSGKYQEENFLVSAAPNTAYIRVYDLPWLDIKTSDPNMSHVMEAINDTNSKSGNHSVIVSDPDEKGVRNVYTCSVTILPEYKPVEYLDSLMCDMLNSKRTFADCTTRQRPWLKQARHPIGFNAIQHKDADSAKQSSTTDS